MLLILTYEHAYRAHYGDLDFVNVFEVLSKPQVLEGSLSYCLSFQSLHGGDFFFSGKCSQKIKMSLELLASSGNRLQNAGHGGGSRKEKGGIFFCFLMSSMSVLIKHPFVFE